MPCAYVRGTGGRYGRTAHMMPRKMVDDENQKFSEKVAFVLIDLTKFAAQTPVSSGTWLFQISGLTEEEVLALARK